MLNKPKFLSPSVNMYGNTVIDLNADTLPFSCIVDGNEAVTDFQIVISRLKDNVVVFDTGMHKLATPFFPINNRNQNVVFSVNLKDYFTKISDNAEHSCIPFILNIDATFSSERTYYTYDKSTGVYSEYVSNYATSKPSGWDKVYSSLYIIDFINSDEAYYWTITFKNSNSGTETYSVAEVFYANSTPETIVYYSYNNDFSDLSDSVDFSGLQKRKIYFKSTYSQPEGVSLKRYGWRLTDITNNVVIMDTITQNQIYGIADDISCVCNGLINQTDYQLELYIETQNGYFGILQSIEFSVDYAVKSIDADFEVEALNNTSGILLSWNKLRTTEGVVVGNSVSYTDCYPLYSSSSIEIPENTSIVFSKTSNDKDLKINKDSYIVLSFGFDKTQNTTLFEISGADDYLNVMARKLEYIASDRMLKYTITNGDIVKTCEKQLSETISELCWYIVTLYPLIGGVADYKLVESVSEEGLFPDEDLYPTDEDDNTGELLYPDFGEWNKLRGGVN